MNVAALALRHSRAAVLLACATLGVPVTVHAAIGAEIIHLHPTTDGAAVGATSYRDFLRLAEALLGLDARELPTEELEQTVGAELVRNTDDQVASRLRGAGQVAKADAIVAGVLERLQAQHQIERIGAGGVWDIEIELGE